MPLLNELKNRLSHECFQTWCKDLSVASVDGGVMRVNVPNRYVKLWLEDHYKQDLVSAATCVSPDVSRVELCLTAAAIPETLPSIGSVLEKAIAPPGSLHNGSGVDRNRPSRETVRITNLSPKFKLDGFVIGKANRVAFAAAQSIAETPGTLFNPVFLHGGQGLGKTHLLHGIGHLLIERGLNIVHITCEEFANAYISAVQNKRLDSFRARFRSCDALLVDGIEFLTGREKTQEEFLHTFDALHSARKQIVLCSNPSPREIKKLDPRIAARFESGLVARLDAPDHALRMGVLAAKAKSRELELDAEVLELLATHVESSIGALEGAICKLMALTAAERVHNGHGADNNGNGHSAERKLPDRELTLVALRELGYLRSGPVTLDDILNVVSRHYHASPDELRSEKRYAALVRARHMGMYLSKMLTSHSVSEIGRFYGNRDHATVLHAARKIADELKRDENMRHDLQTLRQVLGR